MTEPKILSAFDKLDRLQLMENGINLLVRDHTEEKTLLKMFYNIVQVNNWFGEDNIGHEMKNCFASFFVAFLRVVNINNITLSKKADPIYTNKTLYEIMIGLRDAYVVNNPGMLDSKKRMDKVIESLYKDVSFLVTCKLENVPCPKIYDVINHMFTMSMILALDLGLTNLFLTVRSAMANEFGDSVIVNEIIKQNSI